MSSLDILAVLYFVWHPKAAVTSEGEDNFSPFREREVEEERNLYCNGIYKYAPPNDSTVKGEQQTVSQKLHFIN